MFHAVMPTNPATPANGVKRRLLVVDDHPTVRLGVRHLVESEPDLQVCGEAGDAAQLLDWIDRREPVDLVILDISLPNGRNGLDLLKTLAARRSCPKILVYSMHEEEFFARRALRAGARGYVGKDAAEGELVKAIRVVLDGRIHLSDRMQEQTLQLVAGNPPEAGDVSALTDRELEVLELLGHASTTREAAQRLGLSVKTVDTHRENIKAKLGLGNNSELLRRAVQWTLMEA